MSYYKLFYIEGYIIMPISLRTYDLFYLLYLTTTYMSFLHTTPFLNIN